MLKQNQVNIFTRNISLKGSQMKNEDPLIIPIAAPAYEALKEAMKVTPQFDWRPQGDSNPRYRRERAVS